MKKDIQKEKKTILVITILIALSVAVTFVMWFKDIHYGQSLLQSADIANQVDPSNLTDPVIIVVDQDNANALELLQKDSKVKVTTYESGSYIQSIDGIDNTEQNYWAIKINDVYVEDVSVNNLILDIGDTVTFIYVSTQLPLP